MADGSLGFVAAGPSLPPTARAPHAAQTSKPELRRQPSGLALGAAASFCLATLRRRDRRGAARGRMQSHAELGSRETPAPHDLLLRVARGEPGDHTPVWLMRQAGRYMKDFRKYSERYPFRPTHGASSPCTRFEWPVIREFGDMLPARQRSETPDMAIELSLQCWRQLRSQFET